MGNKPSAEAPEAPPSAPPGEFSVRVSPALLQSTGAAGDAAGPAAVSDAESNEMLQRAYQAGVEAATRQFEQQQAGAAAEAQVRRNEELKAEVAEQQRLLHERVEALHAREYRAPMRPMLCKAEREAMIECYKRTEGGTPGDVVFACKQAADDLEKCSIIVREAAFQKIAAGSLTAVPGS